MSLMQIAAGLSRHKLLTISDLTDSKMETMAVELPSDEKKQRKIMCVVFLAEFWNDYSEPSAIHYKSGLVKIIKVYPSKAALRRDYPKITLHARGMSCWDHILLDKLNEIKVAFNLTDYLDIPENLIV